MELKFIFDRITAYRTLVILGNFLHCRVWSLCNQLLLQFSADHFETLQTCCAHIEDVKMCMWLFDGTRINFDKITAF